MARPLHELITEQADRCPDAAALVHRQTTLDYATLARQVAAAARGLLALGLNRGERVAIYLPKQVETVAALFGAALAGGVFVPVNPLLKPEQVASYNALRGYSAPGGPKAANPCDNVPAGHDPQMYRRHMGCN